MMMDEHFKKARASRRIRVTAIQQATADYFRLSMDDFMGAGRVRMISRPRQIAMYIARGMTPRSYPELGRLFNKDQSSIRHGVVQIDSLIADDAEIYDAVIVITERVVEQERLIG